MQPSSKSPATTARSDALARGSLGRGFVSGLVPLGPLALIVVGALALAALARQFTAGQGFASQQLAAVLIIILGLLGSAASYIVFCVRALRQVKAWQQMGQTAQASGAL